MSQWGMTMKWRDTLPLARPSLRRSAAVGGVAGTAYLAAMTADRWLTGNRYDDLILWGGLLSRHPVRGRALGALAHYGLSIGLVALYQAVLPSVPRGPAWLRGVLFVQAENLMLYPGVPVLQAAHPMVRSGELPPLTTWTFFGLEALRHAAFGLVLGIMITEDHDG